MARISVELLSFTAEIALWPNCPHYQASPLTAQCARPFSFRRSTINNDVARALQEGLQMQGLESNCRKSVSTTRGKGVISEHQLDADYEQSKGRCAGIFWQLSFSRAM
jgi:hypothetical protein